MIFANSLTSLDFDGTVLPYEEIAYYFAAVYVVSNIDADGNFI